MIVVAYYLVLIPVIAIGFRLLKASQEQMK